MQSPRKKIFIAGIILSCLTAMAVFLGTLWVGRMGLFRVLNTDLGSFADSFFKYWTFLGDGVVWVPIGILVIVYRKQYLPLIVSAILISTFITQGTKNFLFPGEPRPTYGLVDMTQVHTVKGVELHTVNSFPSGHTGTAFTIFLIGCLLVKRWWIVPSGFFYAAMVGYSRIYLAQHFPVDVGAGIVTGVITVLCSAAIQKNWKPLPE